MVVCAVPAMYCGALHCHRKSATAVHLRILVIPEHGVCRKRVLVGQALCSSVSS